VATLLTDDTTPRVVEPFGRVTLTGCPACTSLCRLASRSMVTTGVVDDAVRTTDPDAAAPPSTVFVPYPVTSIAPGRSTTAPRSSDPVWVSPSLACSNSIPQAVSAL